MKLAQLLVELPVVQRLMWKVADGKWTVEEAVKQLKEQLKEWTVDEEAEFVEDVGCETALEWQVAD